MSAIEAVRTAHSMMKRYESESVEDFAERLYQRQEEIYSALPGWNFFRGRQFHGLSAITRDSWIKAAANHVPT